MTEPSNSAVEQAVQARIAAAKVRVQAAKERRDELSAARRRGLARRHAAKLARLADAEEQQLLQGDGQDDEPEDAA